MLTKRLKVSAVRRRIKRHGSRKLVSHKKLKKYARKTARNVMRGGKGEQPIVEIFLCYKGEQMLLTDDLTEEQIKNKQITRLLMCESIISPDTLLSYREIPFVNQGTSPDNSKSLETSKIIGILFKRTEYEWKFFVFDRFPRSSICKDEEGKIEIYPKDVSVNYDDEDILKAIRILSQDENVVMKINKNPLTTQGPCNNFLMLINGKKSIIPGSKNLILSSINVLEKKTNEEVKVAKKDPMNKGDPINSENIHFLNLTKIPRELPNIGGYLGEAPMSSYIGGFQNGFVKPYNRDIISVARGNFETDGYLCVTALSVYTEVKELMFNSVIILRGMYAYNELQKQKSEKSSEQSKDKSSDAQSA